MGQGAALTSPLPLSLFWFIFILFCVSHGKVQNEGSDLRGLSGDRSTRASTLSTSCGIELRPCELNSKEQPPTTASLQRQVVNFGVSSWILDIRAFSNTPHLPQDRSFNDLEGYRNGHSLRAKTYLPTCACYMKPPHTAAGFWETSEVVDASLHRNLQRPTSCRITACTTWAASRSMSRKGLPDAHLSQLTRGLERLRIPG
ncbi:unnamed protein product [Symbiodinium sp. CCMP2592]|nr:unnamed protein product [Symbiodinium sp. CCMP2592]